MKEFIEKLIGRLEERRLLHAELAQSEKLTDEEQMMQARFCGCFSRAKAIVNELADEYINTSTDTSSDTSTTNANRIRSMTDEELAEFLGGIDHAIDDCEFIVKIGDEWLHDSTADILDWLQSEVKGVTENELS